MVKTKYVKPTRINKELATQFESLRDKGRTELTVRVHMNIKMHTPSELIKSPKRRRIEDALHEVVVESAKDIIYFFRQNVKHNVQSPQAASHTRYPPLARGSDPSNVDYQSSYIASVRFKPGPKGKAYVVASNPTFDFVEYGFAIARPPLSGGALHRIRRWIETKGIIMAFLTEKEQIMYVRNPEKFIEAYEVLEQYYEEDTGEARYSKKRKRYEKPSPVYGHLINAAAKKVAMIIYNKSPYPPRYIFRLTWIAYKHNKDHRRYLIEKTFKKYRVKGMLK